MAAQAPIFRRELVVAPYNDRGTYIIKDPRNASYFEIGEREFFLLAQMNGRRNAADIKESYRQRFADRLSSEELLAFLKTANENGLLEYARVECGDSTPLSFSVTSLDARRGAGLEHQPSASRGAATDVTQRPPTPARPQSILAWRKSLFDPDRLFGWLAPKIPFFWTPAFVIASALLISVAVMTLVLNHAALASQFAAAHGVETLIAVAATILLVTTIHEFGHGLTCKHFGGEVHELGFLLLFCMPCLYCNVSDAWLLPEKRKRLWVTFAGGYIELCLWALAVFVWRMTVQDSLVNYLAWIVITVSGLRIFLNFNPFLKLDGYYLLSDTLAISNLRQRALDYLAAHLRWLLWGAKRPPRDERSKTLLIYGVACWVFSIGFLTLMFSYLTQTAYSTVGLWAAVAVAVVGLFAVRPLFAGLLQGELYKMTLQRPGRTTVWLAGGAVSVAALCLIPWEQRANGTFEVRPVQREEVRAPVAGFIKQVLYEEGDTVQAGALVVRIQVPDLDSRIAQKKAQLHEVDAELLLLKTGAREEELAEQRKRIERAREWRDLAQNDLASATEAFGNDVRRLDQKVAQYQAEVQQALNTVERSGKLLKKNLVSAQQHEENQRRVEVAKALSNQAEAEKGSAASLGTVKAEQELALREKQLADEVGALKLLEAGSRPEEIDAQKSRRARILEELSYLDDLQKKQVVQTSVSGLVTTPRLKEKIGQHLEEGELICEVERATSLHINITLPEEEVAAVEPGQRVELKARALPFKIFETTVQRVAPAAEKNETGELQSSLVVYCQLSDAGAELRPGMTGFARIQCGQKPVGQVLLTKLMRYVRTEFWW
ncbi:MAG: HlyD family efflux transporter periplasmic adaptor subunit [Pirellulales bacterium]